MRVPRVPRLATAVAMVLCARAGRAEEAGSPAGGSNTSGPDSEVVVTGSRFPGLEPAAASPLLVIEREQIVASGKASLGELLQTLVVQGNAPGNAVSYGGDGSTRVNLRGIGVGRTLVLVNGRRWTPGGNGADASVDLSLVPSAAVERIEVLTDAASARYGSDAIAGVVNVITRGKARDTRAAAYTGASGHGDGTTLDLNLTSGIGGEHGGLLLAAGYSDQRKVPAANRGFSRFQWYYDSARGRYSVGSGVIPAGVTLRGGVSGTGNALWNTVEASGASAYVPTTPDDPAVLGCGPSASGQTACFRPYLGSGLPAAGDVAVGDGYNFAAEGDVVTPQRRIELFTTGDLRLGSAARAFVEASWVNRRSNEERSPDALLAFGPSLSVSADNVYNPFGKDVEVRRRLVELGRRVTREDVDAFRVVGGLDGTTPDALGPLAGWSWDVSLDWARTSSAVTREGGYSLPAVALALGPSMMVGGQPTCVAILGDPASAIAGCVPLNLFGGPGSITQDQVAAIAYTAAGDGWNELRSFQASASGTLFRLAPDRAASLGVGYELRRLSGAFVNDPITAQGLGSGARGIDTRGAYHVNELHAELAVPIARGLPAADELEATGAVRWSGYSTSGGAVTYALGTRWRPIPDVTLRATYSTAFRAPSIQESFGAQQDHFPSVRDPCRGPTAGGPPPSQACLDAGVPPSGSGDSSTMLHAIVGGNPDVGPETARVATAGVVLEPRGLPNLSVALGWYAMEIDGIIGRYGASVLLAGCYSGAHPEYCSHVVRDPATHFITVISDLNDNSGKLSTAGLDASLRYALPVRRLGRFAVAIDATWLQRIDQTLPDGTVVHGKSTFDLTTLNGVGEGGTFPAWKANAGLTWGLGGLGAGISTRFLGSFHECGSPYDSNGDGVADAAVFDGSGRCWVDSRFRREVAAWHAEDAFLSYAFRSSAGRTHVMAGVRNLGDVPPATIYNGFASATDQYTYDQMGRFFYVRLEQAY